MRVSGPAAEVAGGADRTRMPTVRRKVALERVRVGPVQGCGKLTSVCCRPRQGPDDVLARSVPVSHSLREDQAPSSSFSTESISERVRGRIPCRVQRGP